VKPPRRMLSLIPTHRYRAAVGAPLPSSWAYPKV
jgi:hypothetical protein